MEPRRQRTVVIVEDDLDLIAILAQALSERGMLVHAFTEPTHALEHLSTRPAPDVLLLDYLLPEMNAAQFARALARQGLTMPIVLLTGADRVCQDALHHVPAAMVIKKPFDLDLLFDKLETVLKAA